MVKQKNSGVVNPKMGPGLKVSELGELLEHPYFGIEENVKALFFTMLAKSEWRSRMRIHATVTCQDHFPDALVWREKSGGQLEHLWVEFETSASGFKRHLGEYKAYRRVYPMSVVCWEDDRDDYPGSVPEDVDVISLKDVLEGKEVELKEREPTEEQKKKRAFLDAVRDEFKKRRPDARIGHGGYNYQQLRLGRGNEHFEWWISNKYGLQVGYHLEHPEREKNKIVFDWLKRDEKKIADALGENPIWKEWSDVYYSIVLEQSYDGSEKQKDWAVEVMLKFYNALRPALSADLRGRAMLRAAAISRRRMVEKAIREAERARKAQL